MIRRLIEILTPRERFLLGLLLFASVVMALFQVAGVGSVIPVLDLMANRQAVNDHSALNQIYKTLWFSDTRSFIIFIGAAAIVVIMLSNAFMAVTMWMISKFIWSVHTRLTVDLLRTYMASPYEMFLDRNTAHLRKNVLIEVGRLTSDVIGPLLNLVAFALTGTFLIGFLIWLNPVFAALAVVVLGGGYMMLFLGVRKLLAAAGESRATADAARFKVVSEAFDGVKEIKVLGRELDFVDRLGPPSLEYARSIHSQQVLALIPRYGIEGFAFASILLAVVFFIGTGARLAELLGVVGVYIFAGYRLLPAIQNVYQSFSFFRFNQPVLDIIHADLAHRARPSQRQAASPPRHPERTSGDSVRARMPFTQRLELRNVSFTYPGALTPALSGISVVVPRGSRVAFIGETGAGKTTIVDIILGLFWPKSGAVLVDGIPLDSEELLRKWQNNLGYVPQDIYLIDDTVAANIAFGLPRDAIDLAAVERAARSAQIHEFVDGQLPLKYDTIVGERGVRLSGGQRQRIGIARALYADPEVLVLDEATSDLDSATENAVHAAIVEASRARTVILIAHRLNTTRDCDMLYLIDQGLLLDSGRYEELVGPDGLLRPKRGPGERALAGSRSASVEEGHTPTA